MLHGYSFRTTLPCSFTFLKLALIYALNQLTVDLRLPHGVCHPPERGHHVERPLCARARRPQEHDGHKDVVDERAHDEDGRAAGELHDLAEAVGADGVDHAIGDEHETDVLDAEGAGHVPLFVDKRSSLGTNENYMGCFKSVQ